MRSSRAIVLTCLLAMACVPRTASADGPETRVEVVCRDGVDAALVRFAWPAEGKAPDYRRLPAEIDDSLSAAPPSGKDDCRMGNGWAVRVRGGEGQAFPYGAGGGNPPAFFSLWVDRRKLLSRQQWKPGYGAIDPWIVAVVIRPDRLTTCHVEDSANAPEQGEIACTDEPLQLGRHAVDAVEYARPGSRPPLGSLTVLPGAKSPGLCTKYAAAQGPDWPYVQDESFDDALVWNDVPAKPGYRLAEALVEIAPGVQRKLVSLGSDTHYFDGDVLFLAPVTADAEAQLDPERLLDAEVGQGVPEGWEMISGGQPALYPGVSLRYVHFSTLRIDGRLYFLAWPTDTDNPPTAILVEPKTSGFKAACSFQRIEPNF